MGGVGAGAGTYLNFIGRGWGWALIRGWALINFFCLLDGCFFEVGANSWLGAYSNTYSIWKEREGLAIGLLTTFETFRQSVIYDKKLH